MERSAGNCENWRARNGDTRQNPPNFEARMTGKCFSKGGRQRRWYYKLANAIVESMCKLTVEKKLKFPMMPALCLMASLANLS